MCSPGALLSVIQGLNTIQKDCVKQMGFGALLKMKMNEVPGALSCYVVEKFDPINMKIILREGVEIDVSRESGKNSFQNFHFEKKMIKVMTNGLNNLKTKKMIRLHEIKMNIVASDNADMNFHMNFIALLINSLIESSSLGKANTYTFNYIMKNTNISNTNWYSYLLNCLVKTKLSFDPSNPTSNFVRPSAFLVLLYVYMVNCSVVNAKRKQPVICHWTSEKMKLRAIYQKEILKEFATGHFNEEFDYEQMILMKSRKFNKNVEEDKGNDDDDDDDDDEDDEDKDNDDDDYDNEDNDDSCDNVKDKENNEQENNGVEGRNENEIEKTNERVGNVDEGDTREGVEGNNLDGNNAREKNVQGEGVEDKNLDGKNVGEEKQNVQERGVEAKKLDEKNTSEEKQNIRSMSRTSVGMQLDACCSSGCVEW
uniref:Uncharacterized protein n=1 Tax=Lactuca sativa TaxID=4236 RepID=A0A9R1XB35_LACSA|nr:hypothetical protein LSAT_V11C500272320 [Lactuca sativa]